MLPSISSTSIITHPSKIEIPRCHCPPRRRPSNIPSLTPIAVLLPPNSSQITRAFQHQPKKPPYAVCVCVCVLQWFSFYFFRPTHSESAAPALNTICRAPGTLCSPLPVRHTLINLTRITQLPQLEPASFEFAPDCSSNSQRSPLRVWDAKCRRSLARATKFVAATQTSLRC